MDPLQNSVQEGTTATDTNPGGKHEAAFQRGLKWLGVGIVLMGISFMATFVLFHSDQSISTSMIAVTSVASVCILKGLADMLGIS